MTTSNEPISIQSVLRDKQARRDEAFAAYLRLSGECTYLDGLLEEQPTSELPKEEQPTSELPKEVEMPSALPAQDAPEESEPVSNGSQSGYPLDIDISGVTSHIERVRLLAMQLPNRIFKVARAAIWLTEMGVSKASPQSLESAIYGKMKNRDDFDNTTTEKGYAQFIGHGEFDLGELIQFDARARN